LEQTAIDRELEQAIDPWLEHMRWRSDFQKWREKRIWQENKQQGSLATLETFLELAGIHNQANRPVEKLNGLKILDLGCGLGGLSVALALRGVVVTSFDFNLAYCNITRLRGQRYGLKLDPVNGAGENLPFPESYFDVVICMDVLEHVQNPEKLLAEISRTLKPAGLAYITAINRFAFNDPHYHVPGVNWLPRSLSEPYLKLAGRNKDNSRFKDNQTLQAMHYYRYADIPKLAKRHDFKQIFEYGEVKLQQTNSEGGQSTAKKANTKAWKNQVVNILHKTKILGPAYRLYRSFYKGTYQLALLKA
jgi:2-polyprenyl-3-methyl-5-hydroxy-6-metoxy-1,4-benzoquinol methylase